MKKLFTAVLFVVALFAAVPSQAQIKFGVTGGMNITKMSFDANVINTDNQNGFFIGPKVKFTLPIIGLGMDVSAVYDQNKAKVNDESVTLKYVNIPINVRYNFGLSTLGAYFAFGPQFGFNVGDKNYDIKLNNVKMSDYKLKDSNFSINLGAGVMLLSHLEVGFRYNIALGKTGDVKTLDALEKAAGSVSGLSSNNKTNSWQISAAYYF
jgi:hypothetical protein